MPSISSDDDEIDRLTFELVSADEGEKKDIAEELLEYAIDEHDSVIVAEVVEVIKANTDYTKGDIEEWRDELKDKRSQQLLDIKSITHIKAIAPSDPDEFEFTVETNNHDEQTSFRIPSDDLLQSRAFEQKVLELCHVKVEYSDWEGMLNHWLGSHEIDEQTKEPISTEHAVAEAILDRIRAMDPTTELSEFKVAHDRVLVDFEQNEALVPGKVVDAAKREVAGEISSQKVRSIVDGLMVPGRSRKVRTSEDWSRAWRFDLEKLRNAGILQVDHLVSDGEDGESDGETDDKSDTDDDGNET